jgi:hypothetical protein
LKFVRLVVLLKDSNNIVNGNLSNVDILKFLEIVCRTNQKGGLGCARFARRSLSACSLQSFEQSVGNSFESRDMRHWSLTPRVKVTPAPVHPSLTPICRMNQTTLLQRHN